MPVTVAVPTSTPFLSTCRTSPASGAALNVPVSVGVVSVVNPPSAIGPKLSSNSAVTDGVAPGAMLSTRTVQLLLKAPKPLPSTTRTV